MHGMWFSLNNSCKNKMNDVISQPRKLSQQSSQDPDEKDKHDQKKIHVRPSSFKEIGAGDSSRKIIEKILGDALLNPSKKILKIRKIFRVKNSPEVVEKFEKYRDMVKQKAKEAGYKHPRNLVDGNELLCFYVTTMTCHNRQPELASGPCELSDCNLCQIICSRFHIKCTERLGIQLSTSSKALSESIAAVSKGKNSKKAVIICRIIAGRIKSMKDRTSEDEYDSIRNYKGFCFNSEHLIVKNPNALLPCFVVVIN